MDHKNTVHSCFDIALMRTANSLAEAFNTTRMSMAAFQIESASKEKH
jgi:hypothetical protein